MTLGNGFTANYGYKKDVLLESIQVNNSAGQEYTKQTYTYDDVWNIKSTTLPTTAVNQTRTYSYNGANELTKTEVSKAGNISALYDYAYDKNGNSTTFSLPTKTGIQATIHSINTNKDQITTKTYPSNKKIDFGYDVQGNLAQKTRYVNNTQDSTIQYIYNYQNQLAEVKENGSTIAKYGYDTNRQKIYKKITRSGFETERYYVWDLSGRIIEEIEPATDLHVKYIYSGNEKIVAIFKKGTNAEKVYYFINNAQGTPIVIIDSQGQPRQLQHLDEYGNLEKENQTEELIHFTGKQYEPSTKLFYFNQRYYDPELGRFLQEDSAGQAWNPYLYCANSPLMYTDPDGEFWWIIAGAIAGAVAGGWGKDLTKAQTWGDMAFGATAGLFAEGIAFELGTTGMQWNASAEAYGAVIGTGGVIGGSNNSRSNSGRTGGSTGINTDPDRAKDKEIYNEFKNKFGINDLFHPYAKTGILDGVMNVLANDLGFKEDLSGNYNIFHGYSGGGHSANMAIRRGDLTVKELHVYGSGWTSYEELNNRTIVHLSASDPMSWGYFTRTHNNGLGVLLMPSGYFKGVQYMQHSGIGHTDWQTKK